MRKIILVKSETLKAVEEFAAGLETAEELVDKVLKAARLDRCNRDPDIAKMERDKFYAALYAAVGITAIFTTGIVLLAVIIW